MNKLILGSILVLAASGSALYLRNAAHQRRARETEARQQLAEASAQAALQEERAATLKRAADQSYAEAADKHREAQLLKKELAKAKASAATNVSDSIRPGARLLKDPKMKAMMKKQQLENVEKMAGKIVSDDFVKKWGLNPEQATYLKDLVKKKYGPSAEITMELMAGELNDAQISELGRQFKQQMAEADAAIKAFLGDDAYKTFDWQEKSQEERARVKDFQRKLADQGQPLAPEQVEELVRLMAEERQNFKFKVDYSDPRNFDYEHLHEFFGDENVERYFQDMVQLNDKISLRAEALLTPEQNAQFRSMRQDQLERSKAVVKMTNALFGKR